MNKLISMLLVSSVFFMTGCSTLSLEGKSSKNIYTVKSIDANLPQEALLKDFQMCHASSFNVLKEMSNQTSYIKKCLYNKGYQKKSFLLEERKIDEQF